MLATSKASLKSEPNAYIRKNDGYFEQEFSTFDACFTLGD